MTPLPASIRRASSLLTVVAVTALLASCQQLGSQESVEGLASPSEVKQLRFEPPEETLAGGERGAPPTSARRLVRTVDLVVRVADTTAAAERVQAMAAELGGYVGSMTAQRCGELLCYQLTLRVPVDRLDAAVSRVKALDGDVVRESLHTEDVTDRFVDLEARLRSLRAAEEQLLELLAESRQRGDGAEEIMQVYARLTEVRTPIEQIQGQLQSLEALATLSTLSVELLPSEAAVPVSGEGWRPEETARRSLRMLLAVLRTLGDAAIVVLIVGLPLGVLAGVPLWLLRRRRRRLRARRVGATESPARASS